jgi:hypothetical protein
MASFDLGKTLSDKVSNKVLEQAAGIVKNKISSLGGVKVLDNGNNKSMVDAASSVVGKLGLNIKVDYVTDSKEIAKYGEVSLPALVINDKVVSMGQVLKSEDIEKQIKGLLTK